MIWIAAMVLAYTFIKLGMLLILVKLLFVGIKLAVGVIVGLAIALLLPKGLIKKLFARKNIGHKEQEA
ncbi:MAG: hypothetical protein Q7J38_10310 [Gallionella sp.]|nr:hypothetical protein [Gallionella sp.]